jgi:hypothetical protein
MVARGVGRLSNVGFVQANPAWAEGDALVCVAPMSLDNIAGAFGRRVFGRAMRGGRVG